MVPQGASSSQPKARRLPQNQVHLVASPAVLLTSCVTLGKPLPLSGPLFPPLSGAKNSNLLGRCDDSERHWVWGSLVCPVSAQGGTAKCVTMPIAANVCLGSVHQLADIEKMLQDPAEVTASLSIPQPKPNLNQRLC